MRIRHVAIAFVLLLPAASVAWSHDLWLMPERFASAVKRPLSVLVDVGVKFPTGESPTRADRVDSFIARHGDTKLDLTGLRVTDTSLVGDFTPVETGLWTIDCTLKPRFIELEPAKFDEYLLEDGLADVLALRKERGVADRAGRERYARAVKTFVRVEPDPADRKTSAARPAEARAEPLPGFDRVSGTRIELVPLSDPTALAPGDTLRVRLLFDGKPLAKRSISSGREHAEARFVETRETDEHGEAAFTIAENGRWYLRTVHMIGAPEGDADVDWLSFWATMTFQVR